MKIMKFDLIEFDRFDRFRCFPVFSANKATRLFHSGGEQDEEMCLRVCVCLCVFASVRSIAPPRMRLKKKHTVCVVKKMFRFFRHVFFILAQVLISSQLRWVYKAPQFTDKSRKIQ